MLVCCNSLGFGWCVRFGVWLLGFLLLLNWEIVYVIDKHFKVWTEFFIFYFLWSMMLIVLLDSRILVQLVIFGSFPAQRVYEFDYVWLENSEHEGFKKIPCHKIWNSDIFTNLKATLRKEILIFSTELSISYCIILAKFSTFSWI